jgi:hypothetical protein
MTVKIPSFQKWRARGFWWGLTSFFAAVELPLRGEEKVGVRLPPPTRSEEEEEEEEEGERVGATPPLTLSDNDPRPPLLRRLRELAHRTTGADGESGVASEGVPASPAPPPAAAAAAAAEEDGVGVWVRL